LTRAFGDRILQGLERQAAALRTERLDLGLLLTEERDLPRLDGIGHRLECVARLTAIRQAEDLDRSRRARLLGRAAAIVDRARVPCRPSIRR
jgi:hypothetical protein